MNCQIKKVIISLASLGTAFSGEHLSVHVYASDDTQKLLVGRLDFVGKVQSGFNCPLTVICPDGFSLSATAVDKYGKPFSDRWDISLIADAAMSVAVNIDTSGAQKAIADLEDRVRSSEAFRLLNQKTFIKECLISKATISANKLFIASGVDENINDLIDNAVANAASSVTKDIQLAMLYRGENFFGFGVAVGGQLLSQQTDAEIKQHPAARDLAKLHTVFNLKKHQMENPVHIDLNTLR